MDKIGYTFNKRCSLINADVSFTVMLPSPNQKANQIRDCSFRDIKV